MGQSLTEVRDEAVAGKAAAEARTVACIASGARWIGGSEGGGGWKRVGWELSGKRGLDVSRARGAWDLAERESWWTYRSSLIRHIRGCGREDG